MWNIDLTHTKGILIDIDDTLYPYQPAHNKALQACYEYFLTDFLFDFSFHQFSQGYRAKRREVTERLKPQGACRSRFFAFQSLFEEMKIPQAFNKALEYESHYWTSFIDSMEIFEEVLHFLTHCRKKGLQICGVSDMQAHFQVQKLKALGVDLLIDYLVTSEEVGSEKPAPVIFETALKKMHLKPEQVLMVGDHEEKDIKGAKSLGIKTFHYTPHNRDLSK